MQDIALEKGLPANLDAERFVLGSIMMDDASFIPIAGTLEADDFSLEKHRRIFTRMAELYDRGERIDRITIANELMRNNQTESVDGLSELFSLDDGLPAISNLDSYVRIVKDKSILRRIIFNSQKMIDRCILGEEEPEQILSSAEESLLKLGESRAKDALASPDRIIREFEGGINAFLDPSKRIKGIGTGFIKMDEMTGGLHPGELIIIAARPSMGKTALAVNIAQHVGMNPQQKQTVAVFSLEMSKESLLTRMICASARVDQQKFRAGYLNQDERRRLQKAASEMVAAPLFIDDSPGVNLMDIQAVLAAQAPEFRVDVHKIDARRVVDEERCCNHFGGGLLQAAALVLVEVAGAELLLVDARAGADHASEQRLLRHFEREDRHRLLLLRVHADVLRDIDRQRRFPHRRAGCDDDQLAGVQTAGHLVHFDEAGADALDALAGIEKGVDAAFELANDAVGTRERVLGTGLAQLEEALLGARQDLFRLLLAQNAAINHLLRIED